MLLHLDDSRAAWLFSGNRDKDDVMDGLRAIRDTGRIPGSMVSA